KVIVETSRGVEFGEVTIENKNIDESERKILPIVRRANNKDFQAHHENKKLEAKALEVAGEKAKLHELDMSILSAHYMFDRSKILFYFTAENRIDFRDLVKTLAAHFRTRIELRQIGVRDEARMVGGYGTCGRSLCCSSFLEDFAPISVKNAKEQGLSLNPQKISGSCGRLLCCLKYEEKAYEEMNSKMPGMGAVVSPKDGSLKGREGVVENTYLVRGLVKVKFDGLGETHILSTNDINIIKKGRKSSDDSKVDEKELKNLE
ncbi:MAG: stage 0 sporulation protein, partial [Oscillospiraceae bacterium]|nr:stage 0 sporulation protein [Oscillospiraceae bacterium]